MAVNIPDVKKLFCISFCILAICLPSTAEKIRVTADNVNIRADSNLSSRVMGQVSRDTILEAGIVADAWIGIHPPGHVYGWIHSGLVGNGKITAKRVNIRSGPGINYEVISSYSSGDMPDTQGQFGEWLKVVPPENTIVWISRKFTEPFQPVKTEKTPTAKLSTTTNQSLPMVGIAAKPPKPADPDHQLDLNDATADHSARSDNPSDALSASGITTNMLVESADQAIQLSLTGKLKRASLLWRRPSRYLLIGRDSDGNISTLCYVAGSDKQLEAILNREMTIEGKQYVIQGAKVPLLVASRITLH